MKKLVFIILLALCSSNLIYAQDSVEKPFIEINGTAELQVIPDQIFIGIHLKENIDRDKKTITEQERDLIKAIEAIQISPKKLVVTDANAYYGKVGLVGKEVVSSKRFELEVSDATQAKKVFEQLDKLNIKNASIVRVDHTKLEEYKKIVKINAIKTAKNKAQYLLEAIGEELGGALNVRENNFNTNGVQFRSNQSYSMAYETKPMVELDFKKITLQSSVYTKWGIK